MKKNVFKIENNVLDLNRRCFKFENIDSKYSAAVGDGDQREL